MSGRRNHSCRDSVTVQHAPLISLFALSPSHPLPSLRRHPSWPFHRARASAARKNRREYYRDCDIRDDSSSRDLRDSQLRSRRLRATLLGAKGVRGEGKKIRSRRRRGGQRREGTGRENRAARTGTRR